MAMTVLLADDSEIMRKAIRNLLQTSNGFPVVAEAATFAEVLRLSDELKPHIVILDVHMPDESLVAPEKVKSHLEVLGCCLLAISYSNDDETKSLAATYGARMLLDKMKLSTDLLPALEQCAPGAFN